MDPCKVKKILGPAPITYILALSEKDGDISQEETLWRNWGAAISLMFGLSRLHMIETPQVVADNTNISYKVKPKYLKMPEELEEIWNNFYF